MSFGFDMKQCSTVLRNSISNNEIAGGNLLVLKDGKEAFYLEDGLADIERKLPIKRDSIFRAYSMTKPVTAAAAMILLERGIIDLLDPVSKYLDGFKNQKVYENGRLIPANRDVMIKDLLNMTSGLVYGGVNETGKATEELFREIDSRLLGDSPLSTVDIANKLGRCPLAFHPGEAFEYGTSADVLGAVIEIAAGMRFGEFLRTELFDPLEMNDTGFWLTEEKRGRLVNTYGDDGKGGLQLYTGNFLGIINSMDREPAFESGGAGLVTTIDDYSKFAAMLMNEGCLNGVQVLRPRTVKYFSSGRLSPAQQKYLDYWTTLPGYSYSNLMRVMTDCDRAACFVSPGEYGWDGWLGTYFCNCPADGLTFLFMIQKKDAGTMPVTRKLRNVVLSAL